MIKQIMRVPYLPGGRDWKGADCWGLVLLCLKHAMGVEASSHDGLYYAPGQSPESAQQGIQDALSHEPEFAEVQQPRRGDFVLMSLLNHPVHIGFMLGPSSMLHTQMGVGPAVADLASPKWARRVRGYYRHKDLLNGR